MALQHWNSLARGRILSTATKTIQNGNCTGRNYSSKKHRLACSEPGKTIYQPLTGRDLISFSNYTKNDILSLLWVATDMKAASSSLQIARGKRICLVWSNPLTKLSLASSSHRLQASLSSFHETQFPTSVANLEMIGKTFGSAADVVFLDTPSWDGVTIENFAFGCTCPVVVISSLDYCPGIAFSEMLTLFEKYEFLRRLEIACISYGKNTLLNTYFTLLPTIGMHLRYITFGESIVQSAMEKGFQSSSRNNTEIREFESVPEALYRSHCLSTSITNAAVIEKQLVIKDIKEMDLDWSLLQHDSFNGLAVSADFLKATNHNLIFKSIENLDWIFQAAVVAYTTEYFPKTPPPRFEGID